MRASLGFNDRKVTVVREFYPRMTGVLVLIENGNHKHWRRSYLNPRSQLELLVSHCVYPAIFFSIEATTRMRNKKPRKPGFFKTGQMQF